MKQVTWLLLGSLIIAAAHAASFDCGKATTDVEKMICGDTELSRLDEEMATEYERARKTVRDPAAIKRQQREWLADIRKRCSDAACFKAAYESRIAQLASTGREQVPTQAKQPASTPENRAMGLCTPVTYPYNLITVISDAMTYFQKYEHQSLAYSATVAILQGPRHGILRLAAGNDWDKFVSRTADPFDPDANDYAYLPHEGYVGGDKAVLLVDFGGQRTVKMVYFFHVPTGGKGDNAWEKEVCGKQVDTWTWKIS